MIVPPVNLGGVYAFNWLRNRLRWSEAATAAAAFAICGAGIALWTAAGRGSVAVTILMLIVSTTCMTGASTMLLSLLPLRFHAMGRMATVTGLLNASAYVGSALASTGFGGTQRKRRLDGGAHRVAGHLGGWDGAVFLLPWGGADGPPRRSSIPRMRLIKERCL